MRESRFDHGRGNLGALAGTCTHQRAELVDEAYDLATRDLDLIQNGLEPFLELPSKLCARNYPGRRPLVLEDLQSVSTQDSMRRSAPT